MVPDGVAATITVCLQYMSSHRAHDVVPTLNQRHWRWFNVATTSCAQWETSVFSSTAVWQPTGIGHTTLTRWINVIDTSQQRRVPSGILYSAKPKYSYCLPPKYTVTALLVLVLLVQFIRRGLDTVWPPRPLSSVLSAREWTDAEVSSGVDYTHRIDPAGRWRSWNRCCSSEGQTLIQRRLHPNRHTTLLRRWINVAITSCAQWDCGW